MLNYQKINDAKPKYKDYLVLMSKEFPLFKLTQKSDTSPYARCFAIFGQRLLKNNKWLALNADIMASSIENDLDHLRDNCLLEGVDLKYNKPYLQLLTFSLSAIKILEKQKDYSLESHILPFINIDIKDYLLKVGALEGIPRSGNQAMFMAIIYCHAHVFLNINLNNQILEWQNLHLNAMNEFGFWGKSGSMSHLQFQNGYHQYEIMDYLKTSNVPWDKAANNVATLADEDGRFAPYPGGGGCYDYDAIYIITNGSTKGIAKHRELLEQTANTILNEQNIDGGFCESIYIRPRSFKNLYKSIKHVFRSSRRARYERLRYLITLLRFKNDRINTHWTEYSRDWSESNLWDSWFRMLTIARIDVALNPENISEWGFVDYPGIGFHS